MNADVIIEKIDNGELLPSSHRVNRRLCGYIRYSEPSDLELIAAFDRGDTSNNERWSRPLWNWIDALPVNKQGALRILSGLLMPDEPVDWYYAEFLIHWSREQGVTEEEILSAFGVRS